MIYKKIKQLTILGLLCLCSCNYLDIVPENVHTVEDMFAAIVNREHRNEQGMVIALGSLNAATPLMNYWSGTSNEVRSVYAGIRDCNTFLDNIESVADLPRPEKNRMIAEAKLLKALMHFQLICFYGPICPLRTSPPVDESTQGVRVYREKIDDCFRYVLELVNEVIDSNTLPAVITNRQTELGRFNQAAAHFIKAKVWVYWASPLFNGNTDYNSFFDHNDEPFFNQTDDRSRWDSAAAACLKAIAFCETNERFRLFKTSDYVQIKPLSPEYLRIESLRAAVTENFNVETVWGGTSHSMGIGWGYQKDCVPRFEAYTSQSAHTPGRWSIPIQSVEIFYSSNGVPIEEDKEWQNGEDQKYENRFKIRRSDEAHKRQVQLGEETAGMNFDREPRFYSSLGFDRGKWYGNSYKNTPDNELDCLYPKARYREYSSIAAQGQYNATGYWPKKIVHVQSSFIDANDFYSLAMVWPEMRYADLLLLTAEALNESKTQPDADVYRYIDQVRERAGLAGVVESWSQYSENPGKPTTKSGMRDIIRRERKIELAFEGQYHWDVRRWKTAMAELNRPIQGWTVTETDVDAYYQIFTVYSQRFSLRDYFMPVPEDDIIKNPRLKQNPGY